jgi:multisubunit Na+/H+ antiporter MnhB subunit
MNLELSVFSYLSGSSSNKGAIIGGVVGGVALVLILLALFVWLRLKKKPKRYPRGEIFWKIFESMIVISSTRRHIMSILKNNIIVHLLMKRVKRFLIMFPYQVTYWEQLS